MKVAGLDNSAISNHFTHFIQDKRVQAIAVIAMAVFGSGLSFALCANPVVAGVITAALLTTSMIACVGIFMRNHKINKTPIPEVVTPPKPNEPPTLPKDKINYAKIEHLGITREWVEKVEKNAEAFQFEELKKVLFALTPPQLEGLKAHSFTTWAFPLIEKMVAHQVLSDQECQQLHQQFTKAQLFSRSDKMVEIDSQTKVNYLAFLLASPTFRNEGLKTDDIYVTVKDLVEYLETGNLKLNDLKRSLIQFNSFRHYIGDPMPYIKETKCIPAIKNEEMLKSHIEEIESMQAIIQNDEMISDLKAKVFSSFFKARFGTQIEFQLTKDCWTIPPASLYLLDHSEKMYDFLKAKVNAVTLLESWHCPQEDLKVLKAANPKVFNQITSLVIDLSHHPFNQKIQKAVELFPNVENLMFTWKRNLAVPYESACIDFQSFNELNIDKYNKVIIAPQDTPRAELINVNAPLLEKILFKDPSSVRILTGDVDKDLIAKLSELYPDYQFESRRYGFSGWTADPRSRLYQQIAAEKILN